MKKVYNSFKEVERDLNYLRLKKHIGAETVKLKYAQTKESVSPINIASDLVASVAKKAIFTKILNKIIGKQ
jgi:hypothetical protein